MIDLVESCHALTRFEDKRKASLGHKNTFDSWTQNVKFKGKTTEVSFRLHARKQCSLADRHAPLSWSAAHISCHNDASAAAAASDHINLLSLFPTVNMLQPRVFSLAELRRGWGAAGGLRASIPRKFPSCRAVQCFKSRLGLCISSLCMREFSHGHSSFLTVEKHTSYLNW